MHRRVSLLVAAVLLACATTAAAQQTIFLVRHAERADDGAGASPTMTTSNDPDLSTAGRARAESLAAMLKDAKIAAIVTTQYKRTRQTAEPLAKALGIEPIAVDSSDVAGAADKIKSIKGNVLVVGHSNRVPEIIARLGITETVTIGDKDYDNLFIIQPNGTLLRLHYR